MNYSLTQEKILKAAENFIQMRGYNAFSYKDIANLVGIKTSSIHYYYPSKEDLALAVIDWQLSHLAKVLEDIKKQASSSRQKIISLIDAVISSTFADEMKMCLGGMFASDLLSLPETIRSKARIFFNSLSQWIESVLDEGIRGGELKLQYPASQFPAYLLMQLEGALLLSRLYNHFSYINLLKQWINEVMK